MTSYIACLIDRSEYQSDAAAVIITIITDGAAIVQMLNLQLLRILNDEYASQIFIPYILLSSFKMQLQFTQTYVVWNRYMENTLKSTATIKHGKGIHRGDASGTLIPGN